MATKTLKMEAGAQYEMLARSLHGHDPERLKQFKSLNGSLQKWINEKAASDPSFLEKPFVYVGAYGNELEFALLGGRTSVLIDPMEDEKEVRYATRSLGECGIKFVETRHGELGKGGKVVFEFEIDGNQKRIVFYAEDATKLGTSFKPVELEHGAALFEMPHAPTAVRSEHIGNDHVAKAISSLPVGGLFDGGGAARLPGNFIPSELLGLKPLQKNPIKQDTWLMEKTGERGEKLVESLLSIDGQIKYAKMLREGKVSKSFSMEDCLEFYPGPLGDISGLLDGIEDKGTREKAWRIVKEALYDYKGGPEISGERIGAFDREFDKVFGERLKAQ